MAKSKDSLTGVTVRGNHFYIDGKKARLAGNHTWNTVHKIAGERISLDQITGNFTRLWTFETRRVNLSNSSWGSNTPGVAKINSIPWKDDGSLNRKYYRNLKKVVAEADSKGITVGVVLFEGTLATYFRGSNYASWENHPFNGLGPKDAYHVHTKGRWNKFQKAHVERVTKILEEYDNVIYEVGNELPRKSIKWFQQKVIKWVKQFTDKPVGASYAQGMKPSRGRTQEWLTKIDADWIAPAGPNRIKGFKGPQIFDTDHSRPLYSNLGSLKNAWNDGRSLWLMDGFNGTVLNNQQNLTPDRNFINNII
jgi:hypothetical protein